MSEQEDLAAQFGLEPMPKGYFSDQKLGPGATISLRSLQVGLEVKDLFADAQRRIPARAVRVPGSAPIEPDGGMPAFRSPERPIEFVTGVRFRRP